MKQTKMKRMMTMVLILCATTMQAQDDRFQCDDTCDPDATGVVNMYDELPIAGL